MRKRMPVIFVGHGSPMNAIEKNMYSQSWIEIGNQIEKPKAILAVSAHWFTQGTKITDASQPKTVYDMYGFPDELYRLKYEPEGAPELAHKTKSMISKDVEIDNSWGLDHGAWSVLCWMFPDANIPVFQLSVDSEAAPIEHLKIGNEISALRDDGILIFASGNVVHNLAMVNWSMKDGYPWAEAFDGYIHDKIMQRKFESVVDYKSAGATSKNAFFTPDHYYPLLYAVGASNSDDKIHVFNKDCTMGALSMTSFLFEEK